MATADTPTPPRRGRPPKYLLSGIAICAVCDAPMRIGSQNVRTAAPGEPTRYRVYECAGSAGQPGFHVSMRQEHLDQIVTDAILERVRRPGFTTPRALPEDPDGSERRALQLQIKSDRVWLEQVRSEAIRSKRPSMIIGQERIVLPKIEAALVRIANLDALDETTHRLHLAPWIDQTWAHMSIRQQRHVVELLVLPRIHLLTDEERGMRGPNYHRVELLWHPQST